MTERKGSTVNDNLQAQHNRPERPGVASLVCAAQLKLLLRRQRADSLSSHQRRCLDKLLDGVDFISLSLEGLTSIDSDIESASAGVTAGAMQ